jgi:hypothetical protein
LVVPDFGIEVKPAASDAGPTVELPRTWQIFGPWGLKMAETWPRPTPFKIGQPAHQFAY